MPFASNTWESHSKQKSIIDKAERFLNEMMEPNVVTYNVMLNGICRRATLHPDERFDGTIRNAETLFDEMRQRGID
ncbi:hypothetical protein V6N13_141028 [Hibiscus sabdariffa]|uniref:Pentatricopeptide repeat-containing protein n=1 Tax=Hibiscus sabdariffa TaxID=183260 RepID=A0ABR2Q164_9ROSI